MFVLNENKSNALITYLKGFDVITVLSTGFGKSILFKLLADVLPVKTRQNIILVVCPLSSIIEDQLVILNDVGICADVLRADVLRAENNLHMTESLFEPGPDRAEQYTRTTEGQGHGLNELPNSIVDAEAKIVFAHPEALLSENGRKRLNSETYQKNVIACFIGEAHCVEMWYVG